MSHPYLDLPDRDVGPVSLTNGIEEENQKNKSNDTEPSSGLLEKQLASHLSTHSQKIHYVCQTCQKRFPRLYELRRHMNLHTAESPHICTKCGRKFARGDALACHRRVQGSCAGGLDKEQELGSFKGDGNETSIGGVMYTNETISGPSHSSASGKSDNEDITVTKEQGKLHKPTSLEAPRVFPSSIINATNISPAPKTFPTKTTLKALPTVRDHTTDQLGPEGDEYIPQEFDEAGENKITDNGFLIGGREFRCRTFFVPNRGDKLFMLATECARVLGYRDSYLLFNKNRSLYKVIATQAEKEDLIHQEILTFSYRSRQIAIITAKSIFRQFGSRVIINGRRVRDDYWETKARKQGFTEEDLAGEKRPGAVKATDVTADLTHYDNITFRASSAYSAQPQSYTAQPGAFGALADVSTLPMIRLTTEESGMPQRDPNNIQNPKQEINANRPPLLHPVPHQYQMSTNDGFLEAELTKPPFVTQSGTEQQQISTNDVLKARVVESPFITQSDTHAHIPQYLQEMNWEQEYSPHGPSQNSMAQSPMGNATPVGLEYLERPCNLSVPSGKLKSVQQHGIDQIRETISEVANENQSHSRRSVAFHLQWDLKEFMKQQFDNYNTPIESVITLTGSASEAQAATVGTYLNDHWPCIGTTLLKALQRYLQGDDQAVGGAYDSEGTSIFIKEHSSGTLSVTLSTLSEERIVDVAQAIAWLGCALRTSPTNQICGSKCWIARANPTYGSSKIKFIIDFDEFPIDKIESGCWHAIFSTAVIADGFPIENRSFGKGLEIPIQMMAALGGVSRAVEYGGGVVLKGFSTIFVPIQKQGDSIQWHCVQNADESRITYCEADTRFHSRALLPDVDFDTITNSKARSFLGWWGKITTHLGAGDVNYHNIDWSDTKEPGRSMHFTGGPFGFQNFGATQLNFTPGHKDGRLHIFRSSGTYRKIVKYTTKTPVVLYDTHEKRAWLVPASAVIAHMAQTRHFRERFSIDGKGVELVCTDPSQDVYQSSENMLLENANLKLESGGLGMGDFYFRDLVHSIWTLLERLMDTDVKKESITDPEIRGTLRTTLTGWEFMDIVGERSPVRLKEANIQKSHGGWVNLVRDISAIVLFASGFEDILKPIDGLKLCRRWQRIPKDKDYLTASVSMLNSLYEQAGSRLTKKHLTSTHLQWHRGQELFGSCPDRSNYECNCNRLQQIIHESFSTFGRVDPPGLLEERGAVIFGQGCFFNTRRRITVPFQKYNSIFSQPNRHIQDTENIAGEEDLCSGTDVPDHFLTVSRHDELEEEKKHEDTVAKDGGLEKKCEYRNRARKRISNDLDQEFLRPRLKLRRQDILESVNISPKARFSRTPIHETAITMHQRSRPIGESDLSGNATQPLPTL